MCGTSQDSTSSNQTQKVTATPEERAMQAEQLSQFKQIVGPQTDVQLQGLSLINKLLSGGTNLPGVFQTLAGGISAEAIGNQATSMALKALPGFQTMGLTDSGVAAREISRSIASELLYPTEQFNIGSIQNLLNLALSGQAQVQSPILAGTNTLASSLAGLRSTTTSGTSTTTHTPSTLQNISDSVSIAGKIGSGIGGFLSSFRYKKNIKLWE